MFLRFSLLVSLFCSMVSPLIAAAQNTTGNLGVFEGEGDVGVLTQPSKLVYDPAQQSYTITASGENVWFDKDNFHFVWSKVSGDGYFEADVRFLGNGANPHRKALLMARLSLDPDSPYVDIALHGNGLTALQFREEKGTLTHEVQATLSSPKRARIEKHGDYFTMWLAGEDGVFHLAASSPRLTLGDSFYVGLGMCSHEKDLSESAVFSNVKVSGSPAANWTNATLYSTLEVVTVNSTDRTAVYQTQGRIEAPNWSREDRKS